MFEDKTSFLAFPAAETSTRRTEDFTDSSGIITNPEQSVSEVTQSVSKHTNSLSEGNVLVSTQDQGPTFTTLGSRDLPISTSHYFLPSDYNLTPTRSITMNTPSASQPQRDSLIEDPLELKSEVDGHNANAETSFFDSSGLDWSDGLTEASGSGSGYDHNLEELDQDAEVQFSIFQSIGDTREGSKSNGMTTDGVSNKNKAGDSDDIEISGEEEEDLDVGNHALTKPDKETNESFTITKFEKSMDKENKSEVQPTPGRIIYHESGSGAEDFSGSGEHATFSGTPVVDKPKEVNGEREGWNSEFKFKSKNRSYSQEDLTSERNIAAGKSMQTIDSLQFLSEENLYDEDQNQSLSVNKDQKDRDDMRPVDSREHVGVGVAGDEQDEFLDAERRIFPQLRTTDDTKQEQTEGKQYFEFYGCFLLKSD